jgi:hypothetical protein
MTAALTRPRIPTPRTPVQPMTRHTRACTRVADTVDAHQAAEERELLPLVSRHLPDSEWSAVCRAATTTLSGREQLLVLGLAPPIAVPPSSTWGPPAACRMGTPVRR